MFFRTFSKTARVSMPALMALFAFLLGSVVPTYSDAQSESAPEKNESEQVANNWVLACRAIAPGETLCSVVQRQMFQNGTALLTLEFSGLEKERKPLLSITVPLGTSLEDELSIETDGEVLTFTPFSACLSAGCIARISEQTTIDAILSANTMSVGFMLPQSEIESRNLSLDVPLGGLSDVVKLIRAN